MPLTNDLKTRLARLEAIINSVNIRWNRKQWNRCLKRKAYITRNDVIIGNQKCIQCDELKNLLDEKEIQYNYSDMTEMLHKTTNYWRSYLNSSLLPQKRPSVCQKRPSVCQKRPSVCQKRPSVCQLIARCCLLCIPSYHF